EAYRFNEAAGALYQFVWHSFCDWYLEFTKPLLGGEDEAVKTETRQTTAWAMEQMLRLLHPFMPFITEELYQQTHDDLLILAEWPELSPDMQDAAADREIGFAIELISEIRTVRSEMNVPPGAFITVAVRQGETDAFKPLIDEAAVMNPVIKRLARIEQVNVLESDFPKGTVQLPFAEATLGLMLADVIDLDQERSRLQKEIEKTGKEIDGLDKRLSNEGFLQKAPEDVVAEQRQKREEAAQILSKLNEAMERLEALG
ncbi:MAG: class I tRNA ligase family protein, partial [Alphaproteobacteria bacterium]|nr:class I tRNA ligase family protein [Alphaproteobacteria bacterium]